MRLPQDIKDLQGAIARPICMCDLHAGDAIMRLYIKKEYCQYKISVIARHEAIPNYVGLSMSGIASYLIMTLL